MSAQPSSDDFEINPTSLASDTQKIASSASLYIGGGMVGRAFVVLSQIFMARVLTLEAFGLYSLGWTILRILNVITIFGMPIGILRFGTPFYKEQDFSGLKNILVQAFTITLVGSTFISAIIMFSAGWISKEIFKEPDFTPILSIFALGIPFSALLTVSSATTRLTQQTRYDVLSEQFGRPFIHLCLTLAFYGIGFRLMGFAGAAAVSFAFSFCLNLYFIYRLFPDVIKAKRTAGFFNRELLTLSIPATMIGTVNFINSRIDRVMLGSLTVAEDVAIYQAVSQIVIVFLIIQLAFIAIISPLIAESFHTGEMKRLQQIYLMANKWSLYLGFPLLSLILLAPNAIIVLLFGEKYAGNSTILIILALAEVFNLSTGAVGSIMFMAGRERRYLWISLTAFTSNILLNIFLIPLWGINGAAVATSIGTIILFSVSIIDIKRALNLFPYDKRFIKGIVAISVASLVGYILGNMFSLAPFLEIGLMGVAIVTVYLIILFLLGLDEEDYIFMQVIRLPHKK